MVSIWPILNEILPLFFHQKRPIFRLQHYYYGKIDNTPFSFAMVLPDSYGMYRFKGQVDLKSESKRENFTKYFEGKNWRIHPDWVTGIKPIFNFILKFCQFKIADLLRKSA